MMFSISPNKEMRGPDMEPDADDVFAIIEHSSFQIMLQIGPSSAAELPSVLSPDIQPTASGAIYIRDILDPVQISSILPEGSQIKPIETSWYGMQELHCLDPDGYIISIGRQDPKARMEG